MRAAFALIPEKGHINPAIGPAQALQDLGYDVAMAAPGDIGKAIEAAGIVFHRDLIPPNADTRPTRGRELVELIQDAERLDDWIEQMLLSNLGISVTRARAWYERIGADVVVVDPLYYAAVVAAHQAGLPWVAMSNSLNPVLPPEIDSALLRTVRRLAPRRDEMFRARGMEARFSCCDTISPYLTIAFATEAFTGPPPPGVQLVGPSFPIRARGDEVPPMPIPDGKRLVYASFGSQIFHLPEVFAKVHQACRRLGARLAISAGDLDIGGDWKDCHVYRYAPQLWLLEHAHAFITHGGANSVMEALTAGVPMLVSPMCNDQFHQAWFARRAGVGVVEDLVAAPVDRIAGHLGALFDDARIKERMREVSATYQRNGAREAARLIAALA